METLIDEKYLKGFNHAYLLAEHKPGLLEKLLKATHQNEYFSGMKAGKDEYEKDRIQTRLNELSRLDTKDRDLER
jgi:hypothetical protein